MINKAKCNRTSVSLTNFRSHAPSYSSSDEVAFTAVRCLSQSLDRQRKHYTVLSASRRKRKRGERERERDFVRMAAYNFEIRERNFEKAVELHVQRKLN